MIEFSTTAREQFINTCGYRVVEVSSEHFPAWQLCNRYGAISSTLYDNPADAIEDGYQAVDGVQ